MNSQRRHGLSVFELLIMLAILGFLLGLLLPVLAQMRTAAARIQSENNVKQILLAIHNYQSTNNKLPAGNDKNNFSAHAHLLPFLDQVAVYRQIDFTKPSTAGLNVQVHKLRIPTFVSPLDPIAKSNPQLACSNYLFCAGSKPDLTNNNGGFRQGIHAAIPGSFPDGTSNTVVLGETLIGDSPRSALDVGRQHARLDKDALKSINEDTGVKDFISKRNIAADRGSTWLDGRFLQGTFTATRLANDPRPDVDCGGAGGLSGLRSLSNKVIVGFCDGSARQINTGIELRVWHLLADANDGMVIPNID